MIRVLCVFGTRPEAIKMAPVVQELAERPETFQVRVCVTGQHREMLDSVLDLFGIVPDHDLDVMQTSQSLTDVTTAVLSGLEPVLAAERPDWVLVQGDTTTAMAGALAAFYARIPVGHVEAGLRTHDPSQPFPEEVNRRLVAVVAAAHFAPTAKAATNLEREGVSSDRIVVTGNTVVDAIRQVASMPFDPRGTALASLPIAGRRVVLVTAHRRENIGRGLEEICAGLRTVAERYPGVHLIYPVHPNPGVHEPVHRLLGHLPNVSLLPPLAYRPLVWLLERCFLVVTDSGGLQEEAPGLGKPVLVLRNTTERPEGVDSGAVRLIGVARESIVEHVSRLLDDPAAYEAMSRPVAPYGDGDASRRIVDALRDGQG